MDTFTRLSALAVPVSTVVPGWNAWILLSPREVATLLSLLVQNTSFVSTSSGSQIKSGVYSSPAVSSTSACSTRRENAGVGSGVGSSSPAPLLMIGGIVFCDGSVAAGALVATPLPDTVAAGVGTAVPAFVTVTLMDFFTFIQSAA